MPQEQIDLLEEIGFLWTSSEAKSPTSSPWWMRMYQAFQEHIKEVGHRNFSIMHNSINSTWRGLRNVLVATSHRMEAPLIPRSVKHI